VLKLFQHVSVDFANLKITQMIVKKSWSEKKKDGIERKRKKKIERKKGLN
jgi:hypothetical protein